MSTSQIRTFKSNSDNGGKDELDEHTQIMFFSFGMFIIGKPWPRSRLEDEIEYASPTQPKKHNLPGGAGLYALLGARLLSPPPSSHHCSWILDAGSDFPSPIAAQLDAWQTSTRTRHDPTRLTTRAWNGYGVSSDRGKPVDAEHRAFKYLTPKRRLDVEDLTDAQARGRSWHMVCSPSRCMEIVRKLRLRRERLGCAAEQQDVVVVWEPIPDLCTPAELENLRRAAAMVDVVSPNAEELAAFFTTSDDYSGGGSNQDDLVRRFMGWDGNVDGEDARTTSRTACVVREGKNGSTIYTLAAGRSSAEVKDRQNLCKLHLPAYHDHTMSSQVIDPTGGGNTYLGALALALAYTYPSTPSSPASTKPSLSRPTPPTPKPILTICNAVTAVGSRLSARQTSLLIAGISACVAAGFAIEQNGVPELRPSSTVPAGMASQDQEGRGGKGGETEDDSGSESQERWGGSRVQERVEMYLAREWKGIREQVEAGS